MKRVTFDVRACRRQFPSLDLEVNGLPAAYFDGPGGTQVPQRVIDAVVRYYERSNANHEGRFQTSQESDAIIAGARQAMADFLGAASPDEVAFGNNMTTLNYMLSRALGRSMKPGDEVVITDLDHEANRAPWLALEENGIVVRSVRVNTDTCTLDYRDFEEKVNRRTKVVAAGYASNAVGTVNNVRWITDLAHSVGAACVIDAVHSALHVAVDVADIGCEFLLCSAYKFFGPHVGILYGRKDAFESLNTYKVKPQIPAPPYKIETGTLNHEGIAGVTEAVDFIASLGSGTAAGGACACCASCGAGVSRRQAVIAGFEAIESHERPLFVELMKGLKSIPGVTVYGLSADDRRTPTVAFRLEGKSPGDVAEYLGARGVFVWDGDFYATTLIERLGLADKGGVVRAGVAPYNTLDEVSRLLVAVSDLVER
ncbi:MAG: cysteine desulfurase-like protein [Firmicutes bacterium]|nr:cysteine desulfurase-like protein [Bacillota bacterium]